MTRNHWPFLPLGRIYSSLLAMLRAFWSLEPQAYLVKTYIQQKHAATPQLMTCKQIIRPHFAVSTCCTVLSSHGDDPSWTQYESLFLLSMKSQEQTFYCSYLLQMRHISSRTCSSDRSPLVWTEFLESSREDTDKERSCNWKRLIGKQIESCTLASKNWGALEAPGQMTPSRAAFVCPSRWWSIMNSIRSTVAFEDDIHSTAHICSIWHQDHQVRYFHEPTKKICHLICPRNPNLFQSEFPPCWNIISWKQSAIQREGKCKVCTRKTMSNIIGKQVGSCILAALQARSEEHWKHPDRWLLLEQLLFVAKHVTL